MSFEIQPCKVTYSNNGIEEVSVCSPVAAEFWGLYKRNADGTVEHLLDRDKWYEVFEIQRRMEEGMSYFPKTIDMKKPFDKDRTLFAETVCNIARDVQAWLEVAGRTNPYHEDPEGRAYYKLMQNSVATNLLIIEWAGEFEDKWAGHDWNVTGDYVDKIEEFTQDKLRSLQRND